MRESIPETYAINKKTIGFLVAYLLFVQNDEKMCELALHIDFLNQQNSDLRDYWFDATKEKL